MKQDKLNKYMTGNFELKKKEIIAYKELNKIKEILIKKIIKQRGGASEGKKVEVIANSQIEHFNEKRQKLNSEIDNTLNKFVNDNTTTELIEKIRKDAEDKKVTINENVFQGLLSADTELINNFKDFNDKFLASGIIDNKDGLGDELLKIQQGLFKLQVKMIFSKLKQVKIECENNGVDPINITKLFTSIRQKVDAMNNFMEAQAQTQDTNQITPDGITVGEKTSSQINSNPSKQETTNVQDNSGNNNSLDLQSSQNKVKATEIENSIERTINNVNNNASQDSNNLSQDSNNLSQDSNNDGLQDSKSNPIVTSQAIPSADSIKKPQDGEKKNTSQAIPSADSIKKPQDGEKKNNNKNVPIVQKSKQQDTIKSAITKDEVKITEKKVKEGSKNNDKIVADNIKELENENKLRLQLEDIEKKKRESEEKINELYRKQSMSESQVAVDELNKLKTKQIEAERSEMIIPRNDNNKNIKIENNSSTGLGTLEKLNTDNLKLSNNSLTNTNNILTLLNNNSIDKRLNNLIQQGGNNSSESREIYTRLSSIIVNLKEAYDIFNTNFFLQLIGLISDPEIFNSLYNQIFKNTYNKEQFINLFFIDVGLISNIINKINELDKAATLNINISLKIKRDTFIIKKYIGGDSEFIFNYTILSELLKLEIQHFVSNEILSKELTILYLNLIAKIEEIKKQYSTLKTQATVIKTAYINYVESRKRVFSFIKERCDAKNEDPKRLTSGLRNPRYNILVDPKKNLLLRYYNYDGPAKIPIGPNNWDQRYNDIRDKRKEYYYLGPYDGIYLKEVTSNKTIAVSASTKLLKKIIDDDEDLCIIGYGQSGSGKTSTLIYFKNPVTGTEEDGIIVELCNLKKFSDEFEKISIEMSNIYVYHGTKASSQDTSELSHHKTYPIVIPVKIYESIDGNDKVIGTEQIKTIDFIKHFNTTTKTTSWIFDKDKKDPNLKIKRGLGKFINDAFEARQVEPTPNNPNSSRSHVLVVLTLYKAKAESRKLVICDLAGVENVFTCKNDELLKFDDRYMISDQYNSSKDSSKEMTIDRYFCDQEINNDDGVEISNNTMIEDYNTINKLSQDYGGKPESNGKKGIKKGGGLEDEYSSDSSISVGGGKKSNSKGPKTSPNKSGTSPNKSGTSPNKSGPKTNSKGPKTNSSESSKKNSKGHKPKKKIEPSKITFNTKCEKAYIFDKCPKELKFKDIHFGNLEIVEMKIAEMFGDKTSLDIKNNLLTELVNSGGKIMTFRKSPNASKFIKDTSLSVVTLKSDDDHVKKYGYILYQLKKELEIEDNTNLFNFTKSNIDQKIIDKARTLLEQNTSSLKASENDLKDWRCEHLRLLKLDYNCRLRRNEGFMINRTLSTMRTDIKSLIKSSLKIDDKYLPVYFDQEIFPYCRNINTKDQYFDQFYPELTIDDDEDDEDKEISLTGKILQTLMNTYGVDMTKINFAIFTVINTTDNGKTNNPPNPPYINVNQLIYYLNINYDLVKLKSAMSKVIILIQDYQFYKNNEEAIKISNTWLKTENLTELDIKKNATDLIAIIKANNSSTLIGSLESTDILQNVTYDKVSCSYNGSLDYLLDKFKGVELEETNQLGETIIDLNNIVDNPNLTL